jgi:hypothetical protein
MFRGSHPRVRMKISWNELVAAAVGTGVSCAILAFVAYSWGSFFYAIWRRLPAVLP